VGRVAQSVWRLVRARRSKVRIPVGTRFSSTVQTGPGAHPASCTMGTGSLPGVKSGRGVARTPHLVLVPWSRKSRAMPLLPLWTVRPVQSLSACTWVYFTFTYTSTPPMDRTACTESQCLYKGALYLQLFFFSLCCISMCLGNTGQYTSSSGLARLHVVVLPCCSSLTNQNDV